MLDTPVLLITFNRPDHVRRVLGEIRCQQPRELYVCQDGPRNEADLPKLQAVRDVVMELVDWHCNLHTLYQKDNLGCGAGPSTGISWFFSHVEQGIVMEDDCLPHPDFFGYCEQLLARYSSDERVNFIGSTLYDDRWQCSASYDFSHYMVTGAWAAWRRSWQSFDLDLHAVNAKAFYRKVKALTSNRQEAKWWYYALKEIQQDDRKKGYWDFQFQIHLFLTSSLTIHPCRNLISNIGFDAEGTHTISNEGKGDRQTYPILPLEHPKDMTVDLQRDARCFAKASSKGFLRDFIDNTYNDMLWGNGIGHRLLLMYKRLKGSGYNTHRV